MDLNRTTPLLAILLLSLWIAPVSAAQQLVALGEDPKAAEQFDYCAWTHSERPDTTGLARFESRLQKNASVPVEQVSSAALIVAGVAVARHSEGLRNCRRTFEKGLKQYERAKRKAEKRLPRRPADPSDSETSLDQVMARIQQLWIDDQAMRRAYQAVQTQDSLGSEFWARRIGFARGKMIDAKATSYMQGLLDDYDWIDSHRFGEAVSTKAWLLVQHADRDPTFQQLALDRVSLYLEDGGVRKQDYAYLFDRVAVNTGTLQRFGTQPTWECTPDGLVLAPLAEPETVDERRSEMGLGPVDTALAEMTRSACGR